MNELKLKELKWINKELSKTLFWKLGQKISKNQKIGEKELWTRKRKILAKLNPINL